MLRKDPCYKCLIILVYSMQAFLTSLHAEPKQDGVVVGRDTKGMSIELVSEVKSIQPGKPFRIGVRIRHDKGFHTYWKNPGVVGVPTQIKWELPEGFSVSSIHWPYPELSKMANYACFGYERDTLLYVMMSPPEDFSEENLKFIASVNWMCCSNTCHPGFNKLEINLPKGKGEFDQQTLKLFEKAKAELPKSLNEVSVEIKAKRLSTPAANKIIIEIRSKEDIQLDTIFNSDGQTTPDLEHSLKKVSRGVWLYEAQRSEYSPKSSTVFPFVLKTSKGYFDIVAE